MIPEICRGAVLTMAVTALTACEDGGLTSRDGNATVAASTSGETVTRDVEMPEVFSVRDTGLWDGRPSLGGIWVAHPDVADPERVRIENTENGKTIEGALFRRERENPGPTIQVSSEAANALGILAGKPTELAVIAVREETIEVEAPETVALELPAGADAPVVSVEGEAAIASDLEDNAAVEPVAVTAVAEAPPQGFFGRIREGFRPRAAAPATSAAQIAITADIAAEVAAAAAADPATAPAAIETQTLDPVATAAAGAIARAEAREAERPGNAFVQVGLFSEESNARDAAETLRANGIVPSVLNTTVSGKPFFRVVVGPVATAADRADLVDQIRGLGFSDAFLTSS